MHRTATAHNTCLRVPTLSEMKPYKGCEHIAAMKFAEKTMPVSVPDRCKVERSQSASRDMLIAWAKKYTYTKVHRKRKCDCLLVMAKFPSKSGGERRGGQG